MCILGALLKTDLEEQQSEREEKKDLKADLVEKKTNKSAVCPADLDIRRRR